MKPLLEYGLIVPLTLVWILGLLGCSPAETSPVPPKALITATPDPKPAPSPVKEVKPQPPPISAMPEKVTLDGTVLKHLSGVWKLTPEGLEIIKQTVEKVRSYGSDLMIEVKGYTSSTGTHAQNLIVSRHRAECVARALIDGGILHDRIRIRGMGPENPVADNATHEGRLKNQRVEIEFKLP